MKKSKRNSGDYGWSETWTIVNSDQVAGIQQMISAAVPGVKAEEVSVIDSKKVLSQKDR